MSKFTIGLPAYNEETTVRRVAETVSDGLMKSGVSYDAANIVLIDSESTDRTVAEFEAANLAFPHEVIIVREGIRGKGINLIKFLERARDGNAENALMFDADLISITSDWIQRYVARLLEGVDYVTPAYSRNKYEGSATNHLAFPVIYAASGKYIRQPIGGDFAMSRKFYEHLLIQERHPDTLKYGIDVFFTMAAVFGGFSISSEKLGKKIHKPSFPQLAAMFPHIANALHAQLQINRPNWNTNGPSEGLVADEVEDISFFPHKGKAGAMKEGALRTLQASSTILFSESVSAALNNSVLNEEDWVEVLKIFCRTQKLDESEMHIMTELYKVRVTTFWDLISNLDAVTVESLLLQQAARLRESLYED